MKRMKPFALAAACLLLLSALAGCAGAPDAPQAASSAPSASEPARPEPSPAPALPAAEGISVPESLALEAGGDGSAALNAALLPQGAAGEPLRYTSSDEAVATVSEDGTVTAVGAGECVVRTQAGSLSGETRVTVTVAVTGLRLSASSKALAPGQSAALSVYTSPREAAAPEAAGLACASSDEAVVTASVSGEGRVTLQASAEGAADVTVRYRGFSAVCHVTVTAPAAAPAATAVPQASAPQASAPEAQTPGNQAPAPTPAPTPAPETPAPETPAPTPVPEAPATGGTCPVDQSTLLADGSCALAGLHWMYQEPTNGYSFSDELIQAWRNACNATDAPLNIIIPGGGSMGYTCDQCGGDIVIKGQGPVLGCENGCW